jgi:hypothetical protein
MDMDARSRFRLARRAGFGADGRALAERVTTSGLGGPLRSTTPYGLGGPGVERTGSGWVEPSERHRPSCRLSLGSGVKPRLPNSAVYSTGRMLEEGSGRNTS